ncbi:late competence protein ComER [Paenibacillus sp. P96]|uniref:Pyrroline-5-carboxylate reductase n=1 Tax=Paenibacillus zeirhizosphaerae TaxID=2987519 RepID=A0ABT9FQT5_9BACL|nr:late competence protein ComER [Paenibacillus sp. P96]MDP4097029.1 late competence protein ComER [Paenibacillus sp. P96]
MKVGFIGTGSMGSLLIDAFIHAGVLTPPQITASSRTFAKVQKLAHRHAGLNLSLRNSDTAADSDIVFICVKPLEFKCVIDEIRDVVTPDQIVVSITSPLLLHRLESELPCKVSKIIPSITNLVGSGASLCIHGSRINEEDRYMLENLMSAISKPIRVPESHTRVASDFASCGPAFLAFFLEQWIQAGSELTGMDSRQLNDLAGEMLLGTGKLLTEGGLTPAELQSRVAVPGGITAEALMLLEASLHDVFHKLVRTTHHKYEEDVRKADALFNSEQFNQQQY